MRVDGGVDVCPYVFLISAIDRHEWSASLFGQFSPREIAPISNGCYLWSNGVSSIVRIINSEYQHNFTLYIFCKKYKIYYLYHNKNFRISLV
jgi:hypothetical protein